MIKATNYKEPRSLNNLKEQNFFLSLGQFPTGIVNKFTFNLLKIVYLGDILVNYRSLSLSVPIQSFFFHLTLEFLWWQLNHDYILFDPLVDLDKRPACPTIISQSIYAQNRKIETKLPALIRETLQCFYLVIGLF